MECELRFFRISVPAKKAGEVRLIFQFFIHIWFLFTLNFTITSTIHNYDKNLEKKRTCCSRSIFHHYMFKVIIKILPSVTGDRTK